MIRRLSIPFLSMLLAVSLRAGAAEPARPVRLEGVLFNPELVLRHGLELGLDQAQMEAIHEVMQKAQENFATLQGNLQREVIALNEFLQQTSPDEKKALAQLDKVLDAEREIKRAHLSLVLSIRGKLTPDQQARVRDMQQKLIAEDRDRSPGPQQAMKDKLQRFQSGVRRWRDEGRDMSALQPIMEELGPLMQQGKLKEAEPIVDRGLKVLEEGQKK
jgi:Spy/CpxP family protein refolding chaperone